MKDIHNVFFVYKDVEVPLVALFQLMLCKTTVGKTFAFVNKIMKTTTVSPSDDFPYTV